LFHRSLDFCPPQKENCVKTSVSSIGVNVLVE
jgi:hypothetical protein